MNLVNAITMKDQNINFRLLFCIILIEGFVTIAVEILTMRQLVPVVGNSVVITSLIIGVFLLFLALGYHTGGLCKKDYRRLLKHNFTIATVTLGIGLSYVFIQLVFSYFFAILTENALIALLFYLLLVTSPLVYILGQTVPITTNLFIDEHHVGSISGKVLCLSTLGSFLGSIVTTLVLMNYFGVAWTVFVNFLLLSLLVIMLIDDYKTEIFRLTVIACAGVIIFWLNVSFENFYFIKTNNYGDYTVDNHYSIDSTNAGRLLAINGSPSSYLDSKNQGFPYIELIKHIIFEDLNLQYKQILVLGAGGFSLSAEKTNHNQFTYVDIDGDIADIAKKGFINEIKGKWIIDDARKFLSTTKSRFDVIISDVYNHRHAIPFQLITREYFKSVNDVLSASGIAIFNIIAQPMMKDAYSKRVDNTIRSVFPQCVVIPLHYSEKPTNIVYVCRKTTSLNNNMIYTDNLNRSTIDFFYMPGQH